MRVTATEAGTALAQRGSELRTISLALTGPLAVGEHVLVHLDTAIRTLDAAEADLLERAVAGLEAAARGATHLSGFEDLTDREPQLPPHLEAQRQARSPAPTPGRASAPAEASDPDAPDARPQQEETTP